MTIVRTRLVPLGFLFTALTFACAEPNAELDADLADAAQEEAAQDEPAEDAVRAGASSTGAGAFGTASSAAGPAGLLSEACWGVGVLTSTTESCPDWEDWRLHGKRMFSEGSASLQALDLTQQELPEVLQPFCLYSWAGDGVPTRPDDIEPLGAMSMDCPAVEPAGNVHSAGMAPSLRTAFRAQLEAPKADDDLATDLVMVALVDSESEETPTTQLEHASSLAAIVEDLACPNEGACGVESSKSLALPLSEHGALVEPEGGSYGTRAHVAVGIMEAVIRWRDRVREEGHTRLVVNLSLGWVTASNSTVCGASEDQPWCDDAPGHPTEFMDYLNHPVDDFETRASIEAVHAALMFASCNGAVIVASAGNAHDVSCDTMPVAPATWARYPAPTEDECTSLGLTLDEAHDLSGSIARDGAPFVHPISAIGIDDQDIEATRPGTRTRVAAAGAHATVHADNTALTGTSVSAAAVSAAVALAWSQVPTLSPVEVFDAITLGSRPLGRVAELDEFDGVPGSQIQAQTRALSLCGMLTKLEGLYGGVSTAGCSGSFSQGEVEAILATAINATLVASPPDDVFDVRDVDLKVDGCDVCGDATTVWLPDLVSSQPHYLFNGCASSPAAFAFHAGPNLAGPQPDVPICPDCPAVFSTGGSAVTLALDNAYRVSSLVIVGASLRVVYPWGTEIVDLNTVLGSASKLQTSTALKVLLPTYSQPPSKVSLKASFLDTTTSKVFHRSSQLVVSSK